MTARTALLLARPAAAAERGRFSLMAAATAAAGGLLLADARIARVGGDGEAAGGIASYGPQLAPYVLERGLRPGVVLGVALLLVPVLALAVQALRVGSVARDRRMASLRLAGATPGEVRRVSAAEAGTAGLLGGLLAGPAYLVLWLLLGVLPPVSARLVPAPDALDIIAWPVVIGLCAIGGALAGAAVEGRVASEALGVRRRARPAPPGRVGLAVLLAGAALVVGSFALVAGRLADGTLAEDLAVLMLVLGVVLTALAAGPRIVRAVGRRAAERGGAETLLAGRRLEADPRSPGRVAGVLAICGVVLGVDAVIATDFATRGPDFEDGLGFYLTGTGLTALGILVASAVAVLTLLVGAADQLLDARRPLATLAALGVDEPALVRVLSRQLAAAAVPAVVLGVLGGGLLALLATGAAPGPLVGVVLPTLAAAVVAGLAVALVARLAARLLRTRVRAAIDPENLRVA